MTSVDLYSYIRVKIKSRDLTDSEIDMAFEEVNQVIINYCQIAVVPDALKFTMCNMMVDLLNYDYESNRFPDLNSDTSAIEITDVSGIKEGDTSIQIGNNSSTNTSMRKKALASHRANLDSIVMDYTRQLNQFRRLW